MTDGLTSLLERSNLDKNYSFTAKELEIWDLPKDRLPFLKPANTLQTITCPGCHEACTKKVQKKAGQTFIWCDEPPELGHIPIEKEDLQHWQLNVSAVSTFLSESLGLPAAREIISNRVYDLGVFEGHTMFFVRGLDWPDGKEVIQNPAILNANPCIIALHPQQPQFSVPVISISSLLHWNNNGWQVDKERLALVVSGHKQNAASSNLFRQEGKQWHIRYQDKEIFMPDSKGMAYIQHLLLNPCKDIAAIDLQSLRNKNLTSENISKTENISGINTQDIITDVATIRAVTQRITKLQKNDPDSPELPKLKAYLRQSTHGGKSKAFKDINEKARQAVAVAINRAMKAIQKQHDILGKHLVSSLKQGKVCIYVPEISTAWQ